MTKPIRQIVSALLLSLCIAAWAQSPQATPAPTPSAPASSTAHPADTARPADVDSVDHIIAATYDAISGPAGPRDWDRFRSLFYPGARLIPTRRDEGGAVTARILTPDEYAKRGQDFFSKEGFFENSVSNKGEQWGNIAQVFSTYESRHAKGEKPFARGINSFQLFHDGRRWWVMTIYWQSEDPSNPLPEKYLK